MAIDTKTGEMLTDIVIKGMQDKKAKRVVKIDLTSINASVADFFVVCHGESDRQVKAIADNVEEEVREAIGEKPFSREGETSARWVLLDYGNVVVHVFQKDVREFYEIEELWHDGKFSYYDDETGLPISDQ